MSDQTSLELNLSSGYVMSYLKTIAPIYKDLYRTPQGKVDVDILLAVGRFINSVENDI